MSIEQVYERFKEISGLEAKQAVKWQWLCIQAMEELNTRVRNNIDYEASGGRLSAAAAALAFYKYATLSGDDISGFKAGDITVNMSGNRGKAAYDLWKDSERAIGDLLTDQGFLFKRVNI